MARRVRWAITIAVVAVLLAPVLLDRDGFPLSTYPMYSRARPDQVDLVTAQGVDADGTVLTLSLAAIGSSDDPLIVAGELRAAIRDGRADERCREIAARAAGSDTTIVAVEVVTERHDVVDHVEGDPSLVRRTVHARCPAEESLS